MKYIRPLTCINPDTSSSILGDCSFHSKYYLNNSIKLPPLLINHHASIGPSGLLDIDGQILMDEKNLQEGYELTSIPYEGFDLPELNTCSILNGLSIFLYPRRSYYHWHIDQLMRISLIEYYLGPKVIASLNIFLLGHPLHFMFTSLLSMGIDPHRIYILPKLPQNTLNLRMLIRIPPRISATYCNNDPWDIIPHDLFVSMRNRIIKYNSLILDQLKSTSSPKYIYISRSDARSRRVCNETEVIKVLQRYGFESINLDGMSYFHQISLFSQASIIVGSHGAGLTNILFSSNATILEIHQPAHNKASVSPSNKKPFRPDYLQLTIAAKSKYAYMWGIEKPNSSDIYIDIEQLEKFLENYFDDINAS